MANMAQVEERDALDSPGLPINKWLPLDVVKPPLMDDAIAMQPKEGMDEYLIKVRKPYTITKQRERWTEEEHEKFLKALKLYGRSWRQIQEHIGTKTAVQIRSHAQKFFSKVVRKPGSNNAIEIPPPRPKRKPLHPYPLKCVNSCNGANQAMGQPKLAPISSSSGSDHENGSPVSVLSVMQSDAFGSLMSNPSTRCTSPASSDDGNNVPPLMSGEENVHSQQAGIDQSHKEIDQDNKYADMSEVDSSDEVQETCLKLFGKTVVIPDPRKRCFSETGHENDEQIFQSSNQETSQALLVGEVPAYTAPNGWLLPYSFPFCFGESTDARIAPLHVWWPYYGFPIGHPRGLSTVVQNEATNESDAGISVESSSDSEGNVQTTLKNFKAVEPLRTIQLPEPASNFELKPSVNSAFVRVKTSSSGDQSVSGCVRRKSCKTE